MQPQSNNQRQPKLEIRQFYVTNALPTIGGSNGSRTHLYTVTVYYTNRYTMKPNNLYVFILYYPTPAIFLCWHSVHTGRLYSCFDSAGSSLRPRLSNCCFGSYSDIQLVCIDIKQYKNCFTSLLQVKESYAIGQGDTLIA